MRVVKIIVFQNNNIVLKNKYLDYCQEYLFIGNFKYTIIYNLYPCEKDFLLSLHQVLTRKKDFKVPFGVTGVILVRIIDHWGLKR